MDVFFSASIPIILAFRAHPALQTSKETLTGGNKSNANVAETNDYELAKQVVP